MPFCRTRCPLACDHPLFRFCSCSCQHSNSICREQMSDSTHPWEWNVHNHFKYTQRFFFSILFFIYFLVRPLDSIIGPYTGYWHWCYTQAHGGFVSTHRTHTHTHALECNDHCDGVFFFFSMVPPIRNEQGRDGTKRGETSSSLFIVLGERVGVPTNPSSWLL